MLFKIINIKFKRKKGFPYFTAQYFPKIDILFSKKGLINQYMVLIQS